MKKQRNNSLEVRLGKMVLATPLVMASGTFGYGTELRDILDYRHIGALITKTITLDARPGNPQPRIWETASGMLNTIGLQNPGVDLFLEKRLPLLKKAGTKVFVSFTGSSHEEIVRLLERLRGQKIDALEFNLSCPNYRVNEIMVSQSARLTGEAVKMAKEFCGAVPLIVKLSPNVADISEIAVAAEEAGADILSLINTVKGMAIDLKRNRAVFGGLSGPAIKPVGLRAVYETYRKVKVPLIGMGGVSCGEDVVEYLSAGASAVGIGSALFADPVLPDSAAAFLKEYCSLHDTTCSRLTGRIHGKKADGKESSHSR